MFNKSGLVFYLLGIVIGIHIYWGHSGDPFQNNRLSDILSIHGFVTQGYHRSSDNNYFGESSEGTFENREIGISLISQIDYQLRVGMQIMAYDLGPEGNNRVQIDWAYGDYLYRDWLGIRIGRVKIPIGLYGETRDFEGTRFFSIMPQSLYLASFRDSAVAVNGGSVYGSSYHRIFGNLEYNLWCGDVTIPEDSQGLRPYEDIGPGFFDFSDPHVDYEIGGNLKWNILSSGFSTNLSLLQVRGYEARGKSTQVYQNFAGVPEGWPVTLKFSKVNYVTYGLEYIWKSVILSAESGVFRIHGDLTLDQLAKMDMFTELRGYYVSGVWELTPKFGVGAYYSFFNNRSLLMDVGPLEMIGREDWMTYQRDWALSCVYKIKETNFWLKFEHHWLEGTGLLLRLDNPEGLTKNWRLFVIKAIFMF